jgi:hypothetical protein
MIRPHRAAPPLALVVLLVALPGCRQLAETLRRPATASPADLFQTDLIARSVREVESRVGAPLRVLDLQAENGSLRIQVQDPAKPANVDQYELRDGRISGPAPVQLLGPGDLEASLFPMAAVDLAGIPEFAREALAKLAIPDAQVTSLRIRVDDPPGAIRKRLHGEAAPPRIIVRLYADSARKKGMVDADAGFAILNSIVF